VKLVRLCAVALCASAVFFAGTSANAAKPKLEVKPVPSVTPAATEKLWRQLVQKQRHRQRAGIRQAAGTCIPVRAVFYAGTDWLRLATKLAANGSPCAQYYISVPPLAADKTKFRNDQAWRIRALGPNFHVLAEANVTGWAAWVASTGSTWEQAGIQVRKQMALDGYDVRLGDSWALNELSSAVRRGDGNARANMRAFAKGLYTGDGTLPVAKGTVFTTGMAQTTGDLSVYQARLQDWYEDSAFWTDMAAYASDWSQELYGDVHNYAVAGSSLAARRAYLSDYLQHELALAHVSPGSASAARAFLDSTYSPLANAAWQYDTGFGWTNVDAATMQDYVSAQTYALASSGAHFGFAWAIKNMSGMTATELYDRSGTVLDRLAAAIRDASQPVDPADPGVGACGPFGQNVWCSASVAGSSFNDGWKSFATWRPSLLAFTSAPQTLTAGVASQPLVVDLRTYSGVSLPPGVPVIATLRSSSPTARFAAGAGGPWAPTLDVTIAGGSSTVAAYLLDTKSGSSSVTATAAGKVSGTQAVNVVAAPLARIAVAPSTATVYTGGSRSFAASGSDGYGNPVSPGTVTWTLAAGTPGSISGAGVYQPGNRTGNGSVIATAGSVSGAASVVVRRS
jgi:hypothetical protein